MQLVTVAVLALFLATGCRSAPKSGDETPGTEQGAVDRPAPRPTSKTEFVTILGAYPPVAPFEHTPAAAASKRRELVATNGQVVDWWSLETGKRVERVDLDPPLKVSAIAPAAASDDGALFAFGADDGYVVLRRGESKPWLVEVDKLAGVSTYDMMRVRFSPDNTLLLIESEAGPATIVIDLEKQETIATVPGSALLHVEDDRSVLLIPPTIVDHGDWSTTKLSVPEGELVVATDIIDESRVLTVGLNPAKTRWTFTVFDGVKKKVLFEHSVEMSQEDIDEARYIEDAASLANVVAGRHANGVIRFGAGFVEDMCFGAARYEPVACPPSRESAAQDALASHDLLLKERFADFSLFSAVTPDLKFMPIYVAASEGAAVVIDLTKGMSPVWALDGDKEQRYAAFLRRDLSVEVWDVAGTQLVDEFDLNDASEFDWSAEMKRGPNRGIALYIKGESVFAATSLVDEESFERVGQVVFERKFRTRKSMPIRRFEFPAADSLKHRHHAWRTDPPQLVTSVDTEEGIDETLILRALEDGTEHKITAKWSVGRASFEGDWVRWAPSTIMVSYGLKAGEIPSDDDAPFTSGWNPKTNEQWTATIGEIADDMMFADISPDGKLLVTKTDRELQKKREVHVRHRPTGKVTTLIPPEEKAWAMIPVVHFTDEHLIIESYEYGYAVFGIEPPFEPVGRCVSQGTELNGRVTTSGWLVGALEGHLPWAADVVGCAKSGGKLTLPPQ